VLLSAPRQSGGQDIRHILLFATVFLLAAGADAQSTCPPLLAPAPDPARLLFTPQQEGELGEIVRQQLESKFLVIEDDQVTAYLKRIGDRVARHLPNSGLQYEFLLYDQPEIQAFSMPGGRVYVSRKIVAFLHNEDELAGLLGHELGHLAARQQALDMSRDFREVLGIKNLSSDEDLFGLYNQFMESVRLKKRHSQPSGEEEKSQKIADQLGVQSVARSGYAPQAFPDFLDRLMQTKGKTGNWLTDLFGATRADSKRLREALRDIATLPPSCIEAKETVRSEEFQKWQAAVLHYRGIGHPEHLSGIVSRKQLNNPLRGDIEHFRFSPEGKYLLAQDEGGIYVLSREPLKFLFRIDAADAQPAQFSPDSHQIVFFNSSLRVESWDLERQEQSSVTDVPALHGCRQTELSPDAKYLACLDNNLDLTLYDVASGEVIFKKERFFDFDSGFSGYEGFFKLIYFLTHQDVATLRFSPDGRYFAASSRTREEVVIDLTTKTKISVPGAIHTAMQSSFTFVGSDRIVGVDSFNPLKSPLVEFPSGKVLDHVPLGGGRLVAATNPKYILIRPIQDRPVGAFDLQQKKLVYSNRMSATDVWGDVFVGERLDGEIALYKVADPKTNFPLQLPLGRLSVLRTFTTSPDLKWLAISSRTRGGVWNLETNTRVFHIRAFQNAYYAATGNFFMDFPEFEKASREMGVLSPVTQQTKGRQIDKDDDLTFFGDVYFRTKHNDKNRNARRNFELNALDMATGKPLWSRSFPKQGPWISGSASSGKLIFVWNAKADGLRDELAQNAKLQERWSKENPSDTDFFIEVLNARDGTVSGGAVVRTGKYSFHPEYQEAVGDWLVVTDNLNRVLLYSVSTGEQKAKWFGYGPRISLNGGRLCLSNGRGHLVVYDLHSLKQISDYSFASRISGDFFSGDGKRLFVLTNDQTGYILDVSATPATTAAAKN
jgi:WD40 repeat protein